MTIRTLLPAIGCLSLTLTGLSGTAAASSSATGEEYLSVTESVEPNILFLVDMSEEMEDPCDEGSDTATDTASSSSSSSTEPCITSVFNAIDQVTQHFDWARYGVVGTAESSSDNEYYPIAPLGASYSEISAALSAATFHEDETRNLAEALADLSANYFENTDADDGVDDDGDGFDNDWDEAPVEYWCQETHIIVLSRGQGINDENSSSSYHASLGTDVMCDTLSGIVTSGDEQCLYDNVVSHLYDNDLRSDLTDDQNIIVHTVGIDIDGSSIAEGLFGNAADEIGGAGLYHNANDGDEVISSILELMADIRTGTFSRSTPVISASGQYLIYTFYELTGDSPLAEGHIRAYAIEDDPTSASYGMVDYAAGSTDYGGAVWDGGDLLVSRPVTSGETNPDDLDGFGKRDIFTFWDPAYSLMQTESDDDRRQGFDADFVSAVGGDATALSYMLDTTVDTANPPCADDDSYDLDKDGCLVDDDDLQALVDFARGLPEAEFKNLGEQRGNWKLGDSPHSIPVVVEARNNQYALEPSYRTFLQELEINEAAGTNPDIVLVAANDGMLHAFALEDHGTTTDSDEGEELWAWIPGYLLYRDDYRDHSWSGALLDLMLYGRTFLFDGTPVVDDVWIDEDGDGAKECTTVPDDCEWKRVVIVQQGKGGPSTLALDITSTKSPKFLFEQVDEGDYTALGYTVSRATIANIYDETDSSNPVDRYVGLWGSGRAVPYTSSSGDTYYESTEANLYMWAIGDDYWGTTSAGFQEDSTGGYARGSNGHPEGDSLGSSLDSDSDSEGHYEYAYIAAALTAVDVDSDGDADTVYFPVTTTYTPTDEGGSGPGDVADPGSTWMYKACIDPEDPGELEWVEFFDPIDDGGISSRPEVYYAATTAWHNDGSLGLYWGSGTPYERTGSDAGYFFAVSDDAPGSCSSFTANPITDCGAGGVYTLSDGEGLTSDPIVYAGTVYFSTWTPETDLCDGGTGRLYGLDYEDCSSGMDTNGDGSVDSSDDAYIEEEDSYISGIAVTDMGTVLYGTSNVVTDGSADALGTISVANDPFLGTETVSWMEMF